MSDVPNDVVVEGGEKIFFEERVAPSRAFLEMGEDFDITMGVSFVKLDASGDAKGNVGAIILSRRSTNDAYIKQWGTFHF